MRNPMAIFFLIIATFFSIPEWSEAQWEKVISPEGGSITALIVSGKSLFAATKKKGVFLSTDSGTSWMNADSGLPKRAELFCLVELGKDIIAGTKAHGAFRSTDNGTSWTEINSGLPNFPIMSLATSEGDLFAALLGKGVYKLEENDTTWKEVNSGLPIPLVLCLATREGDLFVGTIGKGIYLSTDNGSNWTVFNPGLSKDASISEFAVIGTNLYAGSLLHGRVFLSKSNETSWIPVNLGLPGILYFNLLDFAVSGENLFLGSFRGVFVSAGYGASWREINSGFSSKPQVISLAVSETYLFAGTKDGNIWRFPLSDLSLALELPEPVLSETDWLNIRKKKPKAVFIPEEIKAVMRDGLEIREGRQDIPFTIFKYLYFPTTEILGSIALFSPSEHILVQLPPKALPKDSLYSVLFFKAKNSDLGYAVADKNESKSVYKANLCVFIEFRQTDRTGAFNAVREVYVPVALEKDRATYDANEEDWYSVGYSLRPGKYTVSMAITRSPFASRKPRRDKLKLVGVNYFDIELPGPEEYQASLDTTPILFVKKSEKMNEADIITSLHRRKFTFSKMQIVPNIDNTMSSGDEIEIFYYVFGAKPKVGYGGMAEYDIESGYEVRDESGDLVILWKNQNYSSNLISQRFYLKKIIQLKDEKGEWGEQRDLASGKYSLVVKVWDKVSGKTVEKKVHFWIK